MLCESVDEVKYAYSFPLWCLNLRNILRFYVAWCGFFFIMCDFPQCFNPLGWVTGRTFGL